ncbi:Fe-S-binding domain-containing protein, partial [bacterium]|nr:Fe-S-binding domain-containing protein [bacterium]
MNFGIHPLLLVTFFPLVGVLVILFLNTQQKKAIRWTALATSLITFGISLWVLSQFQPGTPGIQLELRQPWLRLDGLSIDFYMGVDGLSILMVLLTTFLTPISILSAWSAVEERVKGFMIFFLLLEVGMTGVFLALDLVLFYVFWEFTLIPMYFLIGVWGGERRIYAAVKFFLFTMAGSLLMLLAILVIGFQTGTFAWADLVA